MELIEITEFFQSVKVPMTIMHVLAVVFGMGAALTSDALFSFFGKDKNLNKTELKTLEILSTLVLYGLVVIAISGLALFLSDPIQYLNSAKFLAKMSILVVLLLNGYLLNAYVWPHLLKKKFFTARSERSVRRLAFALGSISVISWVAVCVLGLLKDVPMNYGSIMGVYFIILSLGTLVALGVENRELN